LPPPPPPEARLQLALNLPFLRVGRPSLAAH
jgi:hypothetical protein